MLVKIERVLKLTVYNVLNMVRIPIIVKLKTHHAIDLFPLF